MTVNLVRSGSLYTGVPYAYASVAPRGSLIFTAGACPLDDRGEVVGAGDVRAQASLAVANLATALAESGATLADVLKTTVFVASAERGEPGDVGGVGVVPDGGEVVERGLDVDGLPQHNDVDHDARVCRAGSPVRLGSACAAGRAGRGTRHGPGRCGPGRCGFRPG